MQRTWITISRQAVFCGAGLITLVLSSTTSSASSIEFQSNVVANGSINTTAGNNDRSDWNLVPTYQSEADEGYSNDWKNVSVANDSSNFYIRYQTYRTDNFGGFLSGNQYMFIDTDQTKTTGFNGSTGIGADYMIQGASLFKYSGAGGTDFTWSFEKSLTFDDFPLNDAEMTIDMASLGNTAAFDFVLFAPGQDSLGNYAEDYYPDRDFSSVDQSFFTYGVPEPTSCAIWFVAGGFMIKRRKRLA